MSRVLPAIVALFGLAMPAFAADMHNGPIHPGWGVQVPVAVAPLPRPSVTIVEELGSPPLPYRGFEYPLDNASYFNPPHPAAEIRGSGLSFAHIGWCASRYASYRATDNTFLPPRGQRRTCVSPY